MEHFERKLNAQSAIAGQVDRRSGAAANLAQDLVAGQGNALRLNQGLRDSHGIACGRRRAAEAPTQMEDAGTGLWVIDVLSQQALPTLGRSLEAALLFVERSQLGRGLSGESPAFVFKRDQESAGSGRLALRGQLSG